MSSKFNLNRPHLSSAEMAHMAHWVLNHSGHISPNVLHQPSVSLKMPPLFQQKPLFPTMFNGGGFGGC